MKDDKVTDLDIKEKQLQIEESTTKILDQTKQKGELIEEINQQLKEQLLKKENKGKIQKNTINQFRECNKKNDQ
ncbi:unnamed protein product (macronuclear) [Paramecium tetraurelia]|uniref:Uncharacterized protein n=1 Tax=Paramecium tetraurelia TaxID=5888 RepID=A0CNH8_PARTE|nr:uncharacterized protein GSPATT00008787001 [Paramecium tetraurelia]CAK72345.1 unnamed protein product [Paramecium tetraurelia]|eukprot:XP_001439742.1 hypothetical protein (macronuclear) [Paramecium tetraurelia strain d4-2]